MGGQAWIDITVKASAKSDKHSPTFHIFSLCVSIQLIEILTKKIQIANQKFFFFFFIFSLHNDRMIQDIPVRLDNRIDTDPAMKRKENNLIDCTQTITQSSPLFAPLPDVVIEEFERFGKHLAPLHIAFVPGQYSTK